jgi:ubiquinone/menaquinone biosynthesis C-methylase UbiE
MTSDKILQYVFGVFIFIVACVLIAIFAQDPKVHGNIAALVAALLLFILDYGVFTGRLFKGISFGIGKAASFDLGFESSTVAVLGPNADPIQPRIMDESEIEEKRKFSDKILEEHKLPGQDAPRFSAVSPNALDDLLVRPSAHPMTPMYLLDNMFRIIDWNEAFTIAFDRTMEGRKGRSVLEWTYFLDNYEEVIDHGVKKFSDTNHLPVIDVETIEYSSLRYGKLSAIKRAYQIPDDAEACLAWLVTLDLKFQNLNQQSIYHRDLLRHLGLDLMWSEYAISYDRVLNNTKVYPQLLDNLIGGSDGVDIIPQDARILDLGAGTGNLALKLITTGRDRVIFAVENNRIMLQFLKSKCQGFLRNDSEAGGIIAIKQDITSLFGLENDYFDFVTLNNVLYAVEDADACLKEACRVLKPGGELRLIGPKKDSNLQILFDRIKLDLQETNKYSSLEKDYEHVFQINQLKLGPWLYRWTTKDVEEMLIKAGFSKIICSSEKNYAGQAMLVCAMK